MKNGGHVQKIFSLLQQYLSTMAILASTVCNHSQGIEDQRRTASIPLLYTIQGVWINYFITIIQMLITFETALYTFIA